MSPAPGPSVQKATLTALPSGDPITVHFNPSSLVYTVENANPQQGGDPKRRQFAAQFTGKLTMDLQFDTTDTGADVRQITNQVALFMQASAAANKQGSSGGGANPPAPSVLSFDWGAYHFQGFMESFKETIDFFSSDGIPLRALVSIGLARQDNVFDAGSGNTAPVAGSLVPTSSGSSATSAASQGGDPNASRALAAANGLDSLRFTAGASLQVGGGIQFNAAVGFVAGASVSAGFGISAGAGIGISAGAGIGISGGVGIGAAASAGAGAGFGIGGGAAVSAGVSAGAGFGVGGRVSAGASVGASGGSVAAAGGSVGVVSGATAGAPSSAAASGAVIMGPAAGIGVAVSTSPSGQVVLAPAGGAIYGSRASAGVPAAYGAFSGLETGRAVVSTTTQLDPLRMLPATVGSDVAAGASAIYGLGGVALARTGFATDVGASFAFSGHLTFDDD